MPYLVNAEKRKTLLKYIGKCIDKACKKGKNQYFMFFSLTCYLDIDALKELAGYVKKQVEKNQSSLSGFYVFVDVGDWVKTRRTIKTVNADIANILGLNIKKVKLYPINFSGQLFHAKNYCLISRNKDNEKIGFVLSSSGNLTKQGLGLKDSGNNIEIASHATSTNTLKSFLDLANELKNTNVVSPEQLEKQDDFLLALRIIFSKGSFYHKWEGNISSEVRFKLNLTEHGTTEIEQGTQGFGQYSVASKSVSRDPLNMEEMFENTPKPFPKQFWGIYAIDTLFGRWAPSGIDSLIDKVLSENAQPYIDEIERLTNEKSISIIKKQLLKEATNLKEKGYISDNPENSVDLWENRIKVFRDNRSLISTRIFNYEKIPDVLDSSNRTSILKMLALLKKQFSMRSRLKGIKALLRDEVNKPEIKLYNKKVKQLTIKAESKVNQHRTNNG